MALGVNESVNKKFEKHITHTEEVPEMTTNNDEEQALANVEPVEVIELVTVDGTVKERQNMSEKLPRCQPDGKYITHTEEVPEMTTNNDEEQALANVKPVEVIELVFLGGTVKERQNMTGKLPRCQPTTSTIISPIETDSTIDKENGSEMVRSNYHLDGQHRKTISATVNNLVASIESENMRDTTSETNNRDDIQETPNKSYIASISIANCSTINVGNKHINEIHKQKVVRDLPLHKYLWKTQIKNCTSLERVSCAFVLMSVLFSVSIVIYYFIFVVKGPFDIDHHADWYVSRDQWLAMTFNGAITLPFQPVKLVVIQHSMTPECHDYIECALEVLEIQEAYIYNHKSDTPYNFLIGNDGRVYEGRGWGIQSVSSMWLNPCIISIGFIGDYRHMNPSGQQLNRTKMLLDVGVKNRYLASNYAIIGAKDTLASESPGTYLYKAIQKFENYPHGVKYNRLSCEQLHATNDDPFIDEAPHEWYITVKNWDGDPYRTLNATTSYDPVKLVIIDDFSSRDCYVFIICRSQLRNLQAFYQLQETEISYNFVIGNDGRVYESRGWGIQSGAENDEFKSCAVYIGFLGSYTNDGSIFETKVSKAQTNRTHMLLQEGVNKGFLHKEYIVVGARDIFLENRGPGFYLYNEIRTWPHYDNKGLHRNFTCNSLHKYCGNFE